MDEVIQLAEANGRAEALNECLVILAHATEEGWTLRQFAEYMIAHHKEILHGTRSAPALQNVA